VARVERVNANNGAVIVKVNGLSASDATGNTLVRRTSGGGASFAGMTVSGSVTNSGNNTFTGQQEFTDSSTWLYTATSRGNHLSSLGAGTTGAELFGAATQKSANETIGRITKIRTTDSTGKTNNTFAADSQLAGWSLKANTVYRAEVRLRYTTGGGFGIKFQFATPSLRYASGDWGSGIIAVPAASASFQGVYNSGSNVLFVVSAFNVTGGYATGFFEFETGATAGAAELQWAQASTGATATTLLAGSTITITERTP
jgi:hypothetical protein